MSKEHQLKGESIDFELNDDTILEPGVLEFIVSNERIPQTVEVTGGAGYKYIWLVFPPAGAKNGDTRKHPNFAISEYFSPEGESRGFSAKYEVDFDRKGEIKRRIRSAQRNLDIPGEPLHKKIIRKFL